MTNSIKNVCVIGAGVMGCNIAAHLINTGFNVLLLDQPSTSKDKNENIKKTTIYCILCGKHTYL